MSNKIFVEKLFFERVQRVIQYFHLIAFIIAEFCGYFFEFRKNIIHIFFEYRRSGLYFLITAIGASAHFAGVLGNLPLLAVGVLWMLIHAGVMLAVRRLLRAPVFFLAVGSQANVGGAASAPVVAAAFHPALATVGVLLAVLGYVLGTYVGLLMAYPLRAVARMYGG